MSSLASDGLPKRLFRHPILCVTSQALSIRSSTYRAERQHPAGGTRTSLLSATRESRDGRLTQIKEAPEYLERLTDDWPHECQYHATLMTSGQGARNSARVKKVGAKQSMD